MPFISSKAAHNAPSRLMQAIFSRKCRANAQVPRKLRQIAASSGFQAAPVEGSCPKNRQGSTATLP
jgi:hypothetical protein